MNINTHVLFIQIHVGDNDKMSPHDPLAYWEDHEACWRMQYRGSLGKVIIFCLKNLFI